MGIPKARLKAVLQRGRAPESAEMDQGKYIPNPSTYLLQRGRAPESAEMAHRGGMRKGRAAASTGPRSGERGDGRGDGRCGARGRCASTGPRSGERGDTHACASCGLFLSLLQRGRAPESAEIRCPSPSTTPSVSAASTGPRSGERGDGGGPATILPAGAASTGPRSGERGDTTTQLGSAARMMGFNGAALRRARRCQGSRWGESDVLRFNGAALRRARR